MFKSLKQLLESAEREVDKMHVSHQAGSTQQNPSLMMGVAVKEVMQKQRKMLQRQKTLQRTDTQASEPKSSKKLRKGDHFASSRTSESLNRETIVEEFQALGVKINTQCRMPIYQGSAVNLAFLLTKAVYLHMVDCDPELSILNNLI